MQFLPQELWDDLNTAFAALQATCEGPEVVKQHWRDWVSAETWLLINQRMSHHWASRLCWCVVQCMQRTIYPALKVDCTARMVQVDKSIAAGLTKGNVHKAFCHLKGWYCAATETQTWPCFQTMESKRQSMLIFINQQHKSPIPLVPINVAPVEVRDNAPTDGEIRAAVAKLTNGRSAGASHMLMEHLKEWLWGMKLEEDLETGPNNVGTGDRWRALAQLLQTVWDEGRIPLQLRLAVTVLIPRGSMDYCGIGLLQPIWKVIK
jgi:hypothetical protein